MTDEDREEREEWEERDERAEIPFDEDPPVDPSVPQVGNSRARFFVPSDDGEPGAEGAAAEEPEDEPSE